MKSHAAILSEEESFEKNQLEVKVEKSNEPLHISPDPTLKSSKIKIQKKKKEDNKDIDTTLKNKFNSKRK